MTRKILFFLTVFLSAQAHFCDALSLGIYGSTAVLISKNERFDRKLQFDGTVSFEMDFPVWADTVFLGTSFGFHRSIASSITAGYAYRGSLGMDARAHIAAKALALTVPYRAQVWLGGALGGTFLLDRYEYTLLHFFYPGVFLEPFVEIALAWIPYWSLRCAVTLNTYFRPDLQYSLSAGMKFALRIYPLRIKGAP